MQPKRDPWLLLVDRERGRLLHITHTPHGRPHLEDRDAIQNEWEQHQHHRPSPLGAPDQHAYASFPHEKENRMHHFAKDVAQWIELAMQRHAIDQLHVFAEPRILGELRKTISQQLNGRVLTKHGDLAPLTNDELLRHPDVATLFNNGAAR